MAVRKQCTNEVCLVAYLIGAGLLEVGGKISASMQSHNILHVNISVHRHRVNKLRRAALRNVLLQVSALSNCLIFGSRSQLLSHTSVPSLAHTHIYQFCLTSDSIELIRLAPPRYRSLRSTNRISDSLRARSAVYTHRSLGICSPVSGFLCGESLPTFSSASTAVRPKIRQMRSTRFFSAMYPDATLSMTYCGILSRCFVTALSLLICRVGLSKKLLRTSS